ncbi:MAG: peptidylprolyl isomerase [Zoogloeaceae bacterium]|nr:peptidylprolyl isomerase [Zoogloeaceae bacterium]
MFSSAFPKFQFFLRLVLALLAAVFLTLAVEAREVKEIDRIVAVVGSEAITLSEVNDRLQSVVAQLQRQGTPLPDREILAQQMLERMVMDRAQLQEARDLGLVVDDAQLEQTLDRIAANNKMNREQFHAALQKDGIPYARFREEIREELIISRLREREVESRLTVSEAEIDNFIAQSGGAGGATYRVVHILVRVPEGVSPAQLRSLQTKAETVQQRAKQGDDFAELAAAYSDAPDALQGGDLGWRPLGRLPSIFSDMVGKLSPGETGEILRSPSGFHIVKLIAQRGGEGGSADASVRQTHARHILLRVNEVISETEARRRLADLRERIRHGEAFAELARLYSQDGSAANGGDLGWVNPGDTVPEFERAMDALADGEVSEVVQSPFGFHLIKVERRRIEDMSAEKERLSARRAIRERKMDEAYQDWLRQLRDRTHVEDRLKEE